jgi:hypothetical protein
MDRASHLALRGCMIDGFGPFEEADYRRSWLFFDQVEYVLPSRLVGPIVMPALDAEQEFAVCRPELAPEDLEQILETTWRDAADPALRQLVDRRVPRDDREYAAVLVGSDAQLRGHLTRARAIDPILFLANKLLWYAARHGTVPLAGRDYATELIAHKLRGLGTVRHGHGLLSARGGSAFAAFAAGLALDFVPDEQLVATPIPRLVDFKQRNRELLAQHQLHLVEVAEAFAALPDGSDFDGRLAQLRIQARRERLELDARARDAWVDGGLELTKKAIAAAAAGLFSGLMVLRGHTLSDVLVAALPAAVTAGGVVLSSVVEIGAKARARPTPAMAYLFRAAEAVAG